MVNRRPEHAAIQLTADLVILTVRDDQLQVLLIERGNEPYRGHLALPGGFLRADEDLDSAAQRELYGETGIGGAHLPYLEQLRVYSAPGRDPRGRVVTVAYLALAPNLPVPVAGTDAATAAWAPADPLLRSQDSLAFDHDKILADAVEHARAKLEHTTLAAAFCAPDFTIGDLKRVYEAVWGLPLDLRNFYRKVGRTHGFIVPTGDKRTPDAGRPAALYRRGPASTLYPPMLRHQASDDPS
jgi:8-oxo-dGTP diphosphatase